MAFDLDSLTGQEITELRGLIESVHPLPLGEGRGKNGVITPQNPFLDVS